MIAPAFVVVTPARNEEALIGETIRSMIAQTARPMRWVVVDDGSTDRTAAVVAQHARRHAFIRLLRVERSGDRNFGGKAEAFAAGLRLCDDLDYRFVGNLDADISFDPDYFERVLRDFEHDSALGLAGGMVESRIGHRFVSQNVAPDSVAGAVQLFRRACFEQIGGYRPLRHGGIDAAAEILARKEGWRVRTLPHLRVLEHRRTGTATRHPLASCYRVGQRFHSLGYGFFFLCVRCAYRVKDRPWLIGSLATLLGYLGAAAVGSPLVLPPDAVQFLRAEQHSKLRRHLLAPPAAEKA
jgi:glycosyltransferase involved in cell wall biosynthesis